MNVLLFPLASVLQKCGSRIDILGFGGATAYIYMTAIVGTSNGHDPLHILIRKGRSKTLRRHLKPMRERTLSPKRVIVWMADVACRQSLLAFTCNLSPTTF